jgi:hypothetical protein
MFVRINAPSLVNVSLLKSFNCKKRGLGYAKVIHIKNREERRKSIEENRQVSEISRTMGTQMLAKVKKKK